MKEKKLTDKYYLLISEFRDKILKGESEEDNILKLRALEEGKIIKRRRNTKDLNVVKKRVKEDFYNYDEFIRSVVDAIIKDLKL